MNITPDLCICHFNNEISSDFFFQVNPFVWMDLFQQGITVLLSFVVVCLSADVTPGKQAERRQATNGGP